MTFDLSSTLRAVLLVSYALIFVASASSAAEDSGCGAAQPQVERFLSAADPEQAQQVALELAAGSFAFQTLFDCLREGRYYAPPPATGSSVQVLSLPAGKTIAYALYIPASYDPARPQPLHVYLHGGLNAAQALGRGLSKQIKPIEALRAENEMALYPAAWRTLPWWRHEQIENLSRILDSVKRRFNVDENRIYLSGVSDGGTGVHYFASHFATPWAGFLAYIGSPIVLINPQERADGRTYPLNYFNKPIFIANGTRDALYPAAQLAPFVELLKQIGTDVTFHPQAGSGHDLDFIARERPNIEGFIAAHRRNPYPDRLMWQSDSAERNNRLHWLVIDELDAVSANPPPLADLARSKQRGGLVRLTRAGNKINAETYGVRRYTLLLSPEQVDFSSPVIVTTNGRLSFSGRIEPHREVLLKWAAADNDRTQLYGAELRIDVPPQE